MRNSWVAGDGGHATAALLAACGGGEAEMPEGHHDLGGGVSVVVHGVTNEGGRVAVDLEYFNSTDTVIDKTLEYDAFLHTAAGREADDVLDVMPSVPKVIPPNASARGWEVFRVPSGDAPATLLLYGEIGDDPVVVQL